MKKMIKRKDGSYSQRGLWDNIRANKGSGKEPTKDMLKQESKIKKEENMKSMYKKGGKPSKKKVMKEAKKEGESFMVENKELSFGAPQMKMGGMMKYKDGGKKDKPKNALEALNQAKARNAAKSPAEQDEMYFKAKREQEKKEAMARSVKSQFNQNNIDDFKYNSYMADVHDSFHFNEPGTYNKYYNDKLTKAAEETKKAYEKGNRKMGGAKSMEPGGGGRFAKMVSGLKKEGKSEDSAKAIAASIGRKKYGKSKFQAMAAAGKKKMGGKKC
jgi:hypothetical protein